MVVTSENHFNHAWKPRNVLRERIVGLALLYPNATAKQLSEVYGFDGTYQTVLNWLTRAGVTFRKYSRNKWESVDWDALPLGVVSDKKIAEDLGCHSSTVRNARVSRGIEPAPCFSGGRRERTKRAEPRPLNRVRCEFV